MITKDLPLTNSRDDAIKSLPNGYEPGCSNVHCICWTPGAVCEEHMGRSGEYCPRCGWARECHPFGPTLDATRVAH